MTPEFKEQLTRLATTLYEPFKAPVQGVLEFAPHDHADYENGTLVERTPVIERPDVSQLGNTAMRGWDVT